MTTQDKPSFARYLRTYGSLGPPVPEINIEELLERRRQWKKSTQKTGTWQEIRDMYSRNFRASTAVIAKMLGPIHAVAWDFVGQEASTEHMNEAIVTILNIFLGEAEITPKMKEKVALAFGPSKPAQIVKALECVKTLTRDLSEGQISSLKLACAKSSIETNGHVTNGFQFGRDIIVPPPQMWEPPDISMLDDLTGHIKSLSIVDNFSMNYDTFAASTSKTVTKITGYGTAWLQDQTNTCIKDKFASSFSYEELYNYLTFLLKSPCSNDELQSELFNVLGEERIELLQKLISHRQDIVYCLEKEEVQEGSTEKRIKPWKQTSTASSVRGPQVGCQVVVQSQEEVDQLKQMRRDEKKAQRMQARETKTSDSEEEEFDPTALRASRLNQLAQAQARPIFGPRKVIMPKVRDVNVYPNVYDSQLQAKHAAGYVANRKIMLPEGVDRKDTRLWEEVNIPIADPGDLKVGDEKVMVENLDDIGRLAFSNITALNRIQSIVFETAYHANDNLLICAPTGAGKTNVALLAMLHTIRNNMDESGSRILKDKFKIIYIAPMKALAAEMAKNFSKRLAPLNLSVRELTGDMQLTKREIMDTQVIITTPEKWDVVTRKGTGDVALTQLVRLLIIDEVHLLHGDRGPVVEAVVARTLRLVESSQSMIRIVGLSATLPNYIDVAIFLRVNPYIGLFFFDSRFRPVPLSMSFVGVKAMKNMQQMQDMDDVCYDKVLEQVRKGHQVMVFVHARNATVRTATMLHEHAMKNNALESFVPKSSSQFSLAQKAISKSRNKQLADLFPNGFAIHHAGMLRTDRNLVEKYFQDGLVTVLVCTSTLAWGVNLPAHAVIIRGTEIYDAQHGNFVDLGILDVLQIFGRAGRPQYDKSGHGVIITSHDKLTHYLSLLTNQYPIESNFLACLADNLNAEIVLGTISNIDEAIQWLSYSYLFVRMRKNPQHYGLSYVNVQEDPNLIERRRKEIIAAALKLDSARMIRYNTQTGDLYATDIGRTASHFYIKYDTIETFNEKLVVGNTYTMLTDAQIIELMSHAEEFNQLKIRDDEQNELDFLVSDYCNLPVAGGTENLHGKVNILIQTFLSRARVHSFSLASDQSFISQNAVRIARALFDIVLKQGNSLLAGRMLKLSKMLQLQMWDFHHPLFQFPFLGPDILSKIDERKNLSIEVLREMPVAEIGGMIRHMKKAPDVKRCAEEFPTLEIESNLQPITRSVLRISLTITPTFRWNDKVHGKSTENFWMWIEEPESSRMYHYEYLLLTKKQVIMKDAQTMVTTIPIHSPMPSQLIVHFINDRWLGSETLHSINFKHLILPEEYPPHTDLLPLTPLPMTVLNNSRIESLYSYSHLNSIQTQVFHCLYHTDDNVVLGAPTGSGKTFVAELAIYRVFREQPGAKVVYIAPMKALVRERVKDWGKNMAKKLGKNVIELTGDSTPDSRAIQAADLVVTTPEKWDGVSRSWQTRGYVRQVALLIIDEIHLLGEERGPVLEVIVSRASYIAANSTGTASRKCRIVGLSTALANAGDIASWLGITSRRGMYNFRPSVRPVPVNIHMQGFPGKHYCPRMATMNKPAFLAIRQHSPDRPALIFVSSRRQTRLTAMDLIAYLAGEDDPKQWLHMEEDDVAGIANSINDSNLKLLLPFGIGIHHAGLQDKDRNVVEELFVNQKIQVLIATATLAWGVNFPAHLVILKGTEFYDGKTKRYVDMPITDVLQMVGRAGRPQYDTSAVAVVLVQDTKKEFYKRFLHEPFPVESNLLAVLPDHLNAEIVAGTISTKQEAIDYLTWTYFFRRLLKNPTYYNLESTESTDINKYLSDLVQTTVNELVDSGCLIEEEDGRGLAPTSMARVSSYYYLSHKTMKLFEERLNDETTFEQLLRTLSDVTEYAELPVRHNEDGINQELSKECVYKVDSLSMDSAHTKTFLLFQAHLSRLELPSSDYYTDLKSILDQALRILQAMLDVCAEYGYLATALRTQMLIQGIVQAAWPETTSFISLPYVEMELAKKLIVKMAPTLPELQILVDSQSRHFKSVLQSEGLNNNQVEKVMQVLRDLPCTSFKISVQGWWDGGNTSESRYFPQPPPKENPYIQLHADQDYVLRLKPEGNYRVGNAHASRFPRSKDVGWFLVLGIDDHNELLALKRVPANARNLNLAFKTPDKTGRAILTLYIMSNCYVGIDQQYELHIEVIESSIEAQYNTEVV